jgi:hypothetical protein
MSNFEVAVKRVQELERELEAERTARERAEEAVAILRHTFADLWPTSTLYAISARGKMPASNQI